jgi:hypothetical protein
MASKGQMIKEPRRRRFREQLNNGHFKLAAILVQVPENFVAETRGVRQIPQTKSLESGHVRKSSGLLLEDFLKGPASGYLTGSVFVLIRQ